MKKFFCIFLIGILFILNANFTVPVFAAVDNSKYIPKIVVENGKSNLVFDPELARIARKMSSDTYSMSESKKASITAKTLKNEKFKEADIQQNFHEGNFLDNYLLADNFHVGVKTFEIGGKEKHILVIAFRGSDDFGDWHVNIFGSTSYDGFHFGFYTAADDAHKTLCNKKFDSLNMTYNEYLEKAKTTEDYYILVTGHSLGGAIANIYTEEFLHSKCGIQDSAMCYTFASPTVCTANKAKQRNASNIFNIINTEDMVPKTGYVWSDGARFGTDLKATVSGFKINVKLGIDLTGTVLNTISSTLKTTLKNNHKIGETYEKVTNQVIDNIGSLYKYTISYYNTNNKTHTHNYDYNNGQCYCGAFKSGTTQNNAVSTLDIKLTEYPYQHTQGNNFGLRGTISSNYNIKKIYGYIKQNGNIVQSTEDTPNAKSVDVKGLKLNNNLIFNNLGPGNYSLEVNAIDASGNGTTITKNFVVLAQAERADSSLAINLDSYPVTLNSGSGYGLRGSVTSNYNISTVQGYVINSNGQTVLSSRDVPNSTYMDIRTARLNNDLVFNNLSAGNYTLKVVATDNSGKTVEKSKNFSVVSQSNNSNNSSLSINLEKYPVTLNLGSSYGLRGSVTSNYSISLVSGSVINSNGQTVLSSRDVPNSTYMDIRTAHLNNDLIFNYLSAGNYTMRVVAIDASGRTVETTKDFTVKAKEAYVDHSPNGNGVTGTVSIPSNWDNLSIRTGPSTSYQIIGSMNNGVNCTVYPNKTSNGWYYIEYNGIWGYASGNQINISNNTSSSSSNTRVGIVSIPSNWDDLSIRTGPSTDYQIVGGMRNGVICTVYTDKASNGWYYVEYNGVKGYAAGNRINLQ